MGVEGEDDGFVLTGVGEEVLFIFDDGFEACMYWNEMIDDMIC